MDRHRLLALAVVALALFARPLVAQEHQHGTGAGEKLGSVKFANSCTAAAQPAFTRAVALLHSFEFGPAIEGFNATLKADASCAIAYWGIALSRWLNPFAVVIRPPAQLQQGLDAVERAHAIGAKTAREGAYVDAVSQLYVGFDKREQAARVLAYRDAMADVAAKYPDDPEASMFYALALTAAEEPTDKTYASRLKAGEILERLFARQPDHPGLAHYIIHSYDVPPLAPRALDAARRYSRIAPSAPHALHMPSHIFTRVGAWQDSVDANIASAAVARRDGATAEELHTMDYRAYAYLQMGQDAAVKQLIESLPEIVARFNPDAIGSAAPGLAGVFATAAIPARYALERRAWTEATRLEPHPSRYGYPEAMTYFARALAAAHTADIAMAKGAIAALQDIRDRLTQAKETFWAEQVEIERRGAAAWLALAEGRASDALAEMRAAADREDATEKNAVTPGPLVPARELLGDMLLELKQPAEALEQFEATLKKEPNRFRALYGAAQAATRAGDRATARKYYDQLLKLCEHADKPGRPELNEARQSTVSPD